YAKNGVNASEILYAEAVPLWDGDVVVHSEEYRSLGVSEGFQLLLRGLCVCYSSGTASFNVRIFLFTVLPYIGNFKPGFPVAVHVLFVGRLALHPGLTSGGEIPYGSNMPGTLNSRSTRYSGCKI